MGSLEISVGDFANKMVVNQGHMNFVKEGVIIAGIELKKSIYLEFVDGLIVFLIGIISMKNRQRVARTHGVSLGLHHWGRSRRGGASPEIRCIMSKRLVELADLQRFQSKVPKIWWIILDIEDCFKVLKEGNGIVFCRIELRQSTAIIK
ncbi:hypothetical protein QOT17_020781 [Balamuthia mandrillaris]